MTDRKVVSDAFSDSHSASQTVLYYQGVKFYSPITSSVALLPETLTTAPSAVVVGIIAGMTGHYRW